MKKVAIYGPPRSGTSWLANLFNSHPDVTLRFQPLFSYGHKGALGPDSSLEEIQVFFDAVLRSTDPFALMQAEGQKNYPQFEEKHKATHLVTKEASYLHVLENLLQKDDSLRILGIIRNPLATLASWAQAPKDFSPEWNILDEWYDAPSKNQGKREEFYGYAKWKSAATDFLRYREQYPSRFNLVKYKYLNERTLEVVTELFDFCELNITQQTTDFINNSKSRHELDPYSVYRSKANDEQWCNILPEQIVEFILDDLDGTELEQLLN